MATPTFKTPQKRLVETLLTKYTGLSAVLNEAHLPISVSLTDTGGHAHLFSLRQLTRLKKFLQFP